MKHFAAWLLHRLRASFFAPASSVNLAVARVLIYGFVVYHKWNVRYLWDTQRSNLRPVGIYTWLPVASDATLNAVGQVGQYAALLCVLGLAFRPAAIVCACTMPYLIGLGSNFGKVEHSDNLLAIALVLLAFSRAADGQSIDAWWRQRRGGVAVAPSGEYRWPITAIWLSICGMYCAAGVSKLVHTGWSWALSDNFRYLLLAHHFGRAAPPTQLGVWLAHYPLLCQGVALVALLGELLSPLMLLGRGWALFWGASTFLLQLGIYLMLGVKFRAMIPLFLTFIPWYALYLGTRRLLAPVKPGV